MSHGLKSIFIIWTLCRMETKNQRKNSWRIVKTKFDPCMAGWNSIATTRPSHPSDILQFHITVIINNEPNYQNNSDN